MAASLVAVTSWLAKGGWFIAAHRQNIRPLTSKAPGQGHQQLATLQSQKAERDRGWCLPSFLLSFALGLHQWDGVCPSQTDFVGETREEVK